MVRKHARVGIHPNIHLEGRPVEVHLAVVRSHGLSEFIRAVLFHIFTDGDLSTVSGIHTIQRDHAIGSHNVIQRCQSAESVRHRHTSVNRECRSKMSVLESLVRFPARAARRFVLNSDDSLRFGLFLVVVEGHRVVLVFLGRVRFVVLFDRVAIDKRNRLFDVDVDILHILDHHMHRIARFVTGLVTEHADNRLYAIFETLDTKRILNDSVHRPLDCRKVGRKDFVFHRTLNLYDRSLLVQNDQHFFLRSVTILVHISVANVVTNVTVVVLCDVAVFIQVVRNVSGIAVSIFVRVMHFI